MSVIAAIYARKSTEDAAAASVTRQVEHARAFAATRGWTVRAEHVYIDDGISGAEFRDRPGLLHLLNAARSTPRRFDRVIMAESSRLGRDRLRTELVARDLHEAGIELWYYLTAEREHLDTPEGCFVLAARSFGAELERAKAKERTRDAHEAHARKGYVTGGVVYGYTNRVVYAGHDERGTPIRSHVVREIAPAEAEVVRGIFRMYADAHGLRSISRTLNGDPRFADERGRYSAGAKVPPPRKGSGSWAPSGIRAMLRNPLYRGEVLWGRYRNVDRGGRTRRRERQPESACITREAPELRIIDETVWQRVERRFRSAPSGGKRVTAATAPTGSLLSGVSRCGLCGGPIVLAGSRQRTRCYGCGRRVNRGTTVCGNTLLASAPAIDRQFLEAVEAAVFTEEARRYVFERARELLAAANANAADDQKRLRDEIRCLEASIDALLGAIEAGQARQAPEALLSRLAEREAEKKAAEARLREVTALANVSELELRRDEQELARRMNDLRGEMAADLPGARVVLSRLLEGPVTFEPDLEARIYAVRATLTPSRVMEYTSPTGFPHHSALTFQ